MKAARLAWVLFASCVALMAAGFALQAQVPSVVLERSGGTFALSLTYALVLLVFGFVGTVVASRMPTNPIGWLFLTLALIEGVYELAAGYSLYSLGVAAQPGTPYTAWFADWVSVASPGVIALAVLLFPTGRLLSRRWRPVAWLCVVAMAPAVAHYALAPGPISEFPSLRNPFGSERLGFLRDLNPDVFVLPILGWAVVAVIVRFRRSRGVERQQLKWFAWSAALMAGFLPVGTLAAALDLDGEQAEYLAGFVFAALLCGLPVSAGLAILRYRLYDIDVVIKRTLIYGTLTVSLVATYLVLVLAIRLALSPVTGDSDLAVAASTLAVAALFRPLRTRIQAVVDRRFYRARYDAGRTLEGFTVRLRDELDLETLGTDLRAVVGQTLQPSHVSLWLRGAP